MEAIDKMYTKIDSMRPEEIDELAVGAIQLDRDGKILRYNKYESRFANLDATRVIGKNFFTEVAPCTDVQQFRGKFREGVDKKELSTKFRYRFVFKHQPARNVLITLYYSKITDSVWVFVQPMD